MVLKIAFISSILDLNDVVFQLCSARDDIPYADEVQTLIKDIWEIRIAKLRKSINIMVQEKETHARVRMMQFHQLQHANQL